MNGERGKGEGTSQGPKEAEMTFEREDAIHGVLSSNNR